MPDFKIFGQKGEQNSHWIVGENSGSLYFIPNPPDFEKYSNTYNITAILIVPNGVMNNYPVGSTVCLSTSEKFLPVGTKIEITT